MSDIIRLLPDSIANQIAAGEVIQRPASAVKELLENAVDAGAANIQTIVKDAGKTLLMVIDDGRGMSETDARMSFERHATSKIRSTEDLFIIRTMGFRGEALASIAAVAQVELKSRMEDSELGTCIQIEASEIKKQGPDAVPKGTSISVKNLFFNIPARRNFLKSNAVEMKHIIEEFQRVALANPNISFSLYQNDLEIYHLKAGKLSHRIIGLFGKNYREQMAVCQEETPLMKVQGYLGKPEFAKKTRGEQFFFVNRRYIKNPYLNHAVREAYTGLMPDDNHPFYVLFIEIDPSHIDVNVHPTKTEIKFDDERTIYGIIKSAVKQALGAHNITPSLDFSHDTNIQINLNPEDLLKRDYSTHNDFRTEQAAANSEWQARQKSNLMNWEKLFDQKEYQWENPLSSREKEAVGKKFEGYEVTIESAANDLEDENISNNEHRERESRRNTFQILNKYIVATVKSGLMMIDQQAAHERVLYEKYVVALNSRSAPSQQSLFPQTLELNPGDFELVLELKEEIGALGFVFDIFGKNSILIHGAPTDAGGEEKKIFEGLIEQFKLNRSELSLDKRESMARAMAKQSSIKAGRALGQEEMRSIIDQLFACTNPNYAPNGNLIFMILDSEKIDNFFNR
jgi:DNA mismatch repair protein MutL